MDKIVPIFRRGDFYYFWELDDALWLWSVDCSAGIDEKNIASLIQKVPLGCL